MGELGVLFNPGMRHEREEKLAKQMLREDEGTGRKGRLGIDLESGVVVINSGTARPADSAAASTDTRPTADDDAKADRRPTDDDAKADQRQADDAKVDQRPTDTPRNDRASSGDRAAGTPRTGSRASQHPSAAPSGKARRGAEAAKPTGKSRRRAR